MTMQSKIVLVIHISIIKPIFIFVFRIKLLFNTLGTRTTYVSSIWPIILNVRIPFSADWATTLGSPYTVDLRTCLLHIFG